MTMIGKASPLSATSAIKHYRYFCLKYIHVKYIMYCKGVYSIWLVYSAQRHTVVKWQTIYAALQIYYNSNRHNTCTVHTLRWGHVHKYSTYSAQCYNTIDVHYICFPFRKKSFMIFAYFSHQRGPESFRLRVTVHCLICLMNLNTGIRDNNNSHWMALTSTKSNL